MLEQTEDIVKSDYGTNCVDCERYQKLGEICVLEHGKHFLWEYCRDFEPKVVLPEYNELMRTVRKEMALERKKELAAKKKSSADKKESPKFSGSKSSARRVRRIKQESASRIPQSRKVGASAHKLRESAKAISGKGKRGHIASKAKSRGEKEQGKNKASKTSSTNVKTPNTKRKTK